MLTTDRLHTALFWFLILQCCVISVSIGAASILLALTIVTILVLFVYQKKWIAHATPLDLALLAYISIELICALFSVHQVEAIKNAKRLFLIGIVYGVFVSFTSRNKIHLALRLIVAAIAFLSLIEIVLYFQRGIGRLNIFQSYMTAGGLKMIVSLLIVPFIFSKEIEKKERIFLSAALLPILMALILTNTRSAWLGFIVGIIVISGLQYQKLFTVLIALVLLFFQFAPHSQIDRAKSIVDISHPNNVGRVKMWTTGIEMWKDKPVFGFGDIDLYASYSQYRTPDIDEPAGHLHNIYLQLLVTLGSVGFAVVMFLFFKIIQTEYRIFSKNKNDALIRSIALGALAVFTGFLVNGLFEWNFGDHEIMVFVWFSVGLCLAVNNLSVERKA